MISKRFIDFLNVYNKVIANSYFKHLRNYVYQKNLVKL